MTDIRDSRFAFRAAFYAIVVTFAAVYLATLTSDYYWDGITFALQIEKVADGDRGAALLFHQNHLIYNAFGWLLYKASLAAGLKVRALLILQIANALIGAVAVGVFYRIAFRLTASCYSAIVCSAALGVSAAWWKISTDADAYILCICLLLVCLDNLVGTRPRWVIAGVALAAAMLAHELAALFLPAAIAAVYASRAIERKLRFTAAMSALAGTTAILAYYLCAGLLNGLCRPFEVIRWAVSNPTGKTMATNPISGLSSFARVNFDAIVGHTIGTLRQHGGIIEAMIILAAATAGVIAVLRALPKLRLRDASQMKLASFSQWTPIAIVLAIWTATYAVFLLFWGPLIYFRAFYTPALMLGLAIALGTYRQALPGPRTGAAALAVAAFALLNLGLYIEINMRRDANVLVSAARAAVGEWDDHTVVLFADRNEADTAFEYFNPEAAFRRLTPEIRRNLLATVAEIEASGAEIWLNQGAAASVDPQWLSRVSRGQAIQVDSPNGFARYVRLRPGLLEARHMGN